MVSSLTERHDSVVWILVGTVIAAVVGFVLFSFVGAIVVGIFLYYATRPVYRLVDQRSTHPNLSASLTLLTVGLPILLVLVYAVFIGISELDRLFAVNNLEQFRTVLEPVMALVPGTSGRGLLDILRNNVSRIGSIAGAAMTWLLRLFVIFTIAFYLLRDDHKLGRWFRRTFENQPAAVTFMEDVDDDLTTIYTGNLITIALSGLIAVLVFLGLDLVAPANTGVRFPILLGLLTGVATLIPAIGMKLVYFPYTAYLLWQSVGRGVVPLWFPVVFFLVTLILVDVLPDIFIRSWVSKGELNMGLVLLTYVLGAVAFGWYGVFLAPIVLVTFIHFFRDIFPVLLGADTPS